MKEFMKLEASRSFQVGISRATTNAVVCQTDSLERPHRAGSDHVRRNSANSKTLSRVCGVGWRFRFQLCLDLRTRLGSSVVCCRLSAARARPGPVIGRLHYTRGRSSVSLIYRWRVPADNFRRLLDLLRERSATSRRIHFCDGKSSGVDSSSGRVWGDVLPDGIPDCLSWIGIRAVDSAEGRFSLATGVARIDSLSI